MQSPLFPNVLTLPFAALLLSITSAFAAAPAVPALPETVETHWQGITVSVHQIARLPDNRVSVKFIYRATPTAPEETYIADRPIKRFAPPGMPPGEEGNTGGPPKENKEVYYPYSIEKKGLLIDEATGKTYQPAEEKEGDAVNPGQKDALEVIRPNEGFFLGGIFDCPPINQDDPPKIQTVSFQLPGLKKPVKGVLLPREVNVPHNFYKEPRYLPPGGLEGLPEPSAKP